MAGKGFVSLSLDKQQGKELEKIFKLAGIDCLTASDFHVTIMQDESNPEIDMLSNDKTYTATITGVERLGKPGGDYEAIVLLLDSPEIHKRHKELINAGANHKFDELKTHISIVYKPNDTDEHIIDLIYKLGVLPEKLTFSNETIKETV